ncbi:VCBS repeat-containing protein [Streptomyces sp. TLI_105]|uniref:FG-GAP repeat domain-containing protein n=1 Tax=Streptomyces sp. TLI_105 TaxID=1881019 RepID=UPI000B80C7CD|nr:VCBS repeat-containing protein [Streptomyces sp. TLI_105]
MAKSSGLKRTGFLSRVTVAAITAALVGTTTAAVAADVPQRSAQSATVESAPRAGAFAATTAATAAVTTPANSLYGATNYGNLYRYDLDGNGGFKAAVSSGSGWQYSKYITQVDQNSDGHSDGLWYVENNRLAYMPFDGTPRDIGGGWGIYNRVFSAGNNGGAAADDLIARDSYGVLWLYLGYGNGNLATRTRIGGGWQIYNQMTGKGDMTGDGKADLITRDGSGNLYLFKGTGNYQVPFSGRTKVGAGFQIYNNLLSVGDVNFDGNADLLARDGAGALWLFKGTGNAASPFYGRVKVGSGGWNGFRLMF